MKFKLLLFALLCSIPVAILALYQTEQLQQVLDPKPRQVTNQDPDQLSFQVISDIHVNHEDAATQKKFKQVLEDIRETSPNSDLLVINGDLSNGFPEDYGTLRTILSTTPHPPVEYTIGNHEFYKAFYDEKSKTMSKDTFPNGETDDKALQRFLDFAKRREVYGERVIKGYHFLFLGSEKSRMSDPSFNDDAYLSDQQLDWLKQKLQAAPADKPIFVFLHQPLPYTVSGTHRSGWNRTVIQHEALRSILSEHRNVIFFSGHTHWNLARPTTFFEDKFLMVNDSSAGRPYDPDKSSAVRPESEGLFVEVKGQIVTIRGRDFAQHKWIKGVERTWKPAS
jgi:Icc protein